MKEYVLNYYPDFKCKAEKCQHTCCAGWEINIDEKSLEKYKKESSEFSSTLKSGINFKKSKFNVDRRRRCAFLNDNGLCEIIINLGEKSLCQVCRDHPRFRSFFNDRIEMGLGFSCEQANKIILSFKDKIEPVLIFNDNTNTPLDFNEKNLLDFRRKALDLLQDRNVNINERIDKLLSICNFHFSKIDFKKIIKTFLSFERIDKSWTNRLKQLKKIDFTKNTDQSHCLICEQFLVNSLYRHLSSAEDTMWVRARTIACVFSWWIIKNMFEIENNNDVYNIVRAYSTEVEYSNKNLDKLFTFAYKFIKI